MKSLLKILEESEFEYGRPGKYKSGDTVYNPFGDALKINSSPQKDPKTGRVFYKAKETGYMGKDTEKFEDEIFASPDEAKNTDTFKDFNKTSRNANLNKRMQKGEI